jgi:hypothetical protein
VKMLMNYRATQYMKYFSSSWVSQLLKEGSDMELVNRQNYW